MYNMLHYAILAVPFPGDAGTHAPGHPQRTGDGLCPDGPDISLYIYIYT